MMEKLTFWTTGENMTRITRALWEEGNCTHAMKTAKEGLNMPEDLAIKLLTGDMMLIGNTREGDHTLNLTEDDTGYEGKSIDKMFNYFKERYIELSAGKIEYDFNLRNNMIKGVTDGNFESISDVEREVRGNGINLEKKKFEYLKQLSFLCGISDHSFEDVEKELYVKINKQSERLLKEAIVEKANSGVSKVDVSDWVKHRITSEAAPLEIGKAGDSSHGWISPTGKFYICGYMEHIMTAEKLAEDGIVKAGGDEKDLDDLGWMKLTTNNFFMFGDKFPIPLRNFIMDHWIEMELDSIELNGTTFKNMDDLAEFFESKYGRL